MRFTAVNSAVSPYWKGKILSMKDEKIKIGIYITACCLAIIAAIVGFSGRKAQKEEKHAKIAEITPRKQVETPVKKPVKKVEKPKIVEDVPTPEAKSVSKENKVDEIHFTRPVEGKLLESFSDDDLIYNEALKDWRTHDGVDLEAELGAQVFASANGVVEKVYDSSMGKCVEIDHQNGFKTIYANLDDNITIAKGDEVAEGDVIGLVGNTALGDATELPHLHFEITKDGKNINPIDFLE